MLNKNIILIFIINCFFLISCAPQKDIINRDIATKKINKNKTNFSKIVKKNINFSDKNKNLKRENLTSLSLSHALKKKSTTKFEKESTNNDVIFEFKKERHLEGFTKNDYSTKPLVTKKAIQATFKMLSKTPATKMESLKFNKEFKKLKPVSYKFKNFIKYTGQIENQKEITNILVILPLSGNYKKFGKRIRQSLDLGLLETSNSQVKLLYFDSGKEFTENHIVDLVKTNNPLLILGPLLRENLIKIKPIIFKYKIPIISFTNDNSLADNLVWITGFSPEQQMKKMITHSIKCKKNNFGFVGMNNNYGKMVLDFLLSSAEKNSIKKTILLSKSQMKDKDELNKVLKEFLNYTKMDDKIDTENNKINSIFVIGDTNFVLEVMPILSYNDLDTNVVDVLGTSIMDDELLINEHSLINVKFPLVDQKNKDVFEKKWKSMWSTSPNNLARLAYDISKISIWLTAQTQRLDQLIKSNKNKFSILGNRFKFLSNGKVERPLSIVKIDTLGKLKTINNCH